MNDPDLTAPLVGGCVCGLVRFAATSSPLRITVCHCLWCQRRTGSAFGVEVVFAAEALALSGDALGTRLHRSDESGRWIEQRFCTACGANAGLRLEAVPEVSSVPAGAFDEPAALEGFAVPVRHVFTRSARPWSIIPPEAERFERHFRR